MLPFTAYRNGKPNFSRYALFSARSRSSSSRVKLSSPAPACSRVDASEEVCPCAEHGSDPSAAPDPDAHAAGELLVPAWRRDRSTSSHRAERRATQTAAAAHARSATHGESSNTHPTASMKAGAILLVQFAAIVIVSSRGANTRSCNRKYDIPFDAHFAHAFGAGQHEQRGERLHGVVGTTDGCLEHAPARADAHRRSRPLCPDENRRSRLSRPRASAPARVARYSSRGASSGDGFGRQPLHQIGLQPFLQHPEPQPTTDIGAQGTRHAGIDMALERKTPLPSDALLPGQCATAVPGSGKPIELRRGGMNVVRHHRSIAAQLIAFIDREIVGRPWKQPRQLLDFGWCSR